MRLLRTIAAILAALAPPALVFLAGLAIDSYNLISVQIDRTRVVASHPFRVEEAAALAPRRPHAGDLVDAEARVILKLGGEPPVFWVNGVKASRDQQVPAGARISWRNGRDQLLTAELLPKKVGARARAALSVVRIVRSRDRVFVAETIGPAAGHLVRQPARAPAPAPTPAAGVAPTVPPPTIPAAPAAAASPPVPPAEKVVALTFDDGPSVYTPKILRILKRHQVKATFFVVGVRAQRFGPLVRREAGGGHTVGHHSLHHYRLDRMTPEQVAADMQQGYAALERDGVHPRWFRPPGGWLSPAILREVKSQNMTVALWSVDPQDWRRIKAKRLIKRVVRDVRPGAIVLLHDGGGNRRQTVKALPKIIKKLKQRGYRFVTLDELFPPQQGTF